MNGEQWATLAIALVGAITGVLALTAQIWSYVGSGPRIRVTVSAALSTLSDSWLISLDATNVGRLPVEVLEVGLLLGLEKDKRVPVHAMPSGTWHGEALPFRLLDGAQVSWIIDPAVIATAAAKHHLSPKVRGYIRTGTGKRVYSKRANVADSQVLGSS